MACRTFLSIERRTILGGSATGREFLPVGTDRDIPRTDRFCGWSLSQTIRGRLCPHRVAEAGEHKNDDKLWKPIQAHWTRSRPRPPSTAQLYCPNLAHRGRGNSLEPR